MKNGWKDKKSGNGKKSILTIFWVPATPKSWSKYTTPKLSHFTEFLLLIVEKRLANIIFIYFIRNNTLTLNAKEEVVMIYSNLLEPLILPTNFINQ